MFGRGRTPIDPKALTDVSSLGARAAPQLAALGRLSEPLLRRGGEPGFLVASWDEALDRIAAALRTVDPERAAFRLAPRALTAEVYYAAQKSARLLGTNHVDIAARPGDAATAAAMRRALGRAAPTCSYEDWARADLIVLCGAGLAENRRTIDEHLRRAHANRAHVAVLFGETGRERHRTASIVAARWRSVPVDSRFDTKPGGEVAFLTGVLRALIEEHGVNETFVRERTSGYEQARTRACRADWLALEAASGSTRDQMTALARLLARRSNTVLAWWASLAGQVDGAQMVAALIDIGLARGLPGRQCRGLMPFFDDAAVESAGELGCAPGLDAADAARFAHVWEFPPPAAPGWTATGMTDHAADGDVDLFWMVGTDPFESLPDAGRVRLALARPRLRIHQHSALEPEMLAECGGDVLILPAAAPDESPEGVTTIAHDRRMIFAAGVPGRPPGSARPTWWPFGEAMARAFPNRVNYIRFDGAAALRAEIARAVPLYAGVETLKQEGDEVRWGGRTLYADGRFATSDHLARFAPPPIGGIRGIE